MKNFTLREICLGFLGVHREILLFVDVTQGIPAETWFIARRIFFSSGNNKNYCFVPVKIERAESNFSCGNINCYKAENDHLEIYMLRYNIPKFLNHFDRGEWG